MSGRTRLALCAALTTACGGLTLRSVIGPCSWYWVALLAVVMVLLLGIGARRLRLPQYVVTLVQLIGVLELAVIGYARSSAVGGFLPGPGALGALMSRLGEGQADIRTYAPPLPPHTGDQALLVVLVGLLAVAVDLLAVGLGHTAATGLPLLAIYCVPAVETKGGVPWYVFALGAASYLLLLMADARERLLRWGRPLTRGGSPGIRHTRMPSRLENLPALGAGALIAVAVVVAAVGLPGLLPNFGGQIWQPRSPAPALGQGLSVQPMVDVSASLREGANVQLLTVTTTDPTPGSLYLKMYTLEQVDDGQWTMGPGSASPLPAVLPSPEGMDDAADTPTFRTQITVERSYPLKALPVPAPAQSIQADGDWQLMNGTDDVLLLHGDAQSGFTYTVHSYQVDPAAEQLGDAGSPSNAQADLDLSGLSATDLATIRSTARSVTTGAATDIAKARALQHYFTSSPFSYDLNVSYTGADPTTQFLQAKRGFCQQYASTMALMARALGIPARVDVGFSPGTPDGHGHLIYGSHDAHAWPELYFAGAGWLRFEPTPADGLPVPGYSGPNGSGVVNVPPPVVNPTPQQTGLPTVTASPVPGGTAGPDGSNGHQGTNGARNTGNGTWYVWFIHNWQWVLGVVLGVALFLAGCAVPWIVRQRTRLLRRSVPGPPAAPPAARVIAAWEEFTAVVRDHGEDWPAHATPRQVRAILRDALQLQDAPPVPPGSAPPPDIALRPAADAALGRLCQNYESALFAPNFLLTDDPFADVDAVERLLVARAGRWRLLRIHLFPPSIFRSDSPVHRLRRSSRDDGQDAAAMAVPTGDGAAEDVTEVPAVAGQGRD